MVSSVAVVVPREISPEVVVVISIFLEVPPAVTAPRVRAPLARDRYIEPLVVTASIEVCAPKATGVPDEPISPTEDRLMVVPAVRVPFSVVEVPAV